MTGTTKFRARPAVLFAVQLRTAFIVLILASAAWSLSQRWAAPVATQPSETGQTQGAGPAEPAEAPDLRSRLDPSRLWREADAEPPGGPVVRCVGAADEDDFVRLADCEARGGRVAEPSWERSP